MEDENKIIQDHDIEVINNVTNSVTDLSPSQQDRLALDSTRELNIVHFINAQIAKISKRDDLKTAVLNKLKFLVDSNDMEIGVPALVKILEILDKSDNDALIGVLNASQLAKASKEDKKDSLPPDKQNGALEYTPDDMKKLKKVHDLFSKLDSEF